jgi:hypothetical protein
MEDRAGRVGLTLPAQHGSAANGRLREVLKAHFALERAHARREALLQVLAAASSLVWIAAAWPGWVSSGFRTFSLTASALCFAVLVPALLSERRWRRRLDSCSSDLVPAPPSRQTEP